MNSLSWLLYAAEVSQSLSIMLGVSAGGFLLIGGFLCLPSMDEYIVKKEKGEAYRRSYRRGVIFALIALVASALLPSTRTIYMIAASEAGETIVTSPDAIEMMGDLKAIIKKRLKDELGE
jgi:O-antigen ligase